MNIYKVIILGIVLLIIVGFSAAIVFINEKSFMSTIPTPEMETIFTTTPVESTNSTSSTNPTSFTTPPIPDSVINDALHLKFEYIPNLSKDDNLSYRLEIVKYIISLRKVLADMDRRAENYHEASNRILDEIKMLNKLDQLYYTDYEELIRQEKEESKKWQIRQEEYPVATKIWLFLKNEMGYNDYVCAGILGNMMAECGGQTLNLNWKIYNSTNHYGLCQWSPIYHPQMQGASLEQQLAYMKESFPCVMSQQWALNSYKLGFTYEDFLAMEDASEAAYAFCVIYERPGPGSYNVRRTNALKAFEYFTS